MDEAVSGGWAEVSQRVGESCPKDIQAEERLYLGRRWPLNGSVDPPSSPVWFQFMSAPCSWWDRSSPAHPSLFSVLRCIFIFHSPTAESGSTHLGSPLLNPSSWTSLSGPDREYGSAEGGPIGWDADQNKAKKSGRRCEPPPAHGTVSDNFSTSFIYLDIDGNSEAITSNTVSCMHHCYQGDHFLSLAPFFAVMISCVTRDSWGKTISFYTFIGILVNRWLPFCKPPLTVYWRKKRLHEYRMWILHQKSDNQLI